VESAFSHDAVVAALEAKGAAVCSACGEEDHAIALNPTFIPITGVTPIGSTDPSPPQGLEAIVITCINCGLIRLHDARELLDGN